MDAKTAEQEVNTIMTRYDSDWESRSKKEKKAIFAECMKEQNVVWESFSLGQKNWVIHYLGFWKYYATVSNGSGVVAVLAPLVYGLRIHPLGCLTTIAIIAAAVAIGTKVAGLW